MREIRPLLLPQIVAKRQSAGSPRDSMTPLADSAVTHPPSDTSRSHATVGSDCSTPQTPTFSVYGHNRYPSSNSSLGSSPPAHDALESLSSSVKLPKLTEEPVERDTEDEMDADVDMMDDIALCPCGAPDCAHQTYSLANSPSISRTALDDMSDNYFSDDADFTSIHVAKRRRSEDSTINTISTRLEGRFPSFARRWGSKRASGLSVSTRGYASSRAPSMERSSSQTQSQSARPSYDFGWGGLPPTPSQSFVQLPNEIHERAPSSPIDIINQQVEMVEEPIDREALASTPLLPPTLMTLSAPGNTPITSPLQSPTIARSSQPFSFYTPSTGTPCMSNQTPTPPLSPKPSYTSLYAAKSGLRSARSDVPRLAIDEVPDEWSDKLGHANFTILPEPYMPDVCDASTCSELFSAWKEARQNFQKHQVRTGEHVGVTSRTYKLTEEKWAQIDTQWKTYHDIAFARAGFTDDQIAEASPTEPAPLVKLPSLNGKFPSIGDEDIVGPMEQIEAKVQPKQTRKNVFAKFFSDFKFGKK